MCSPVELSSIRFVTSYVLSLKQEAQNAKIGNLKLHKSKVRWDSDFGVYSEGMEGRDMWLGSEVRVMTVLIQWQHKILCTYV
jgi:hypothetical protein